MWSLRLASTDAQPLMAQEHRSRTTEQASWVALVVKNPPARAGAVRDEGAIPGLGRSPREGNDNPLQYSCLGNLMDRGVHGVAKSQTWMSMNTHIHTQYHLHVQEFTRHLRKAIKDSLSDCLPAVQRPASRPRIWELSLLSCFLQPWLRQHLKEMFLYLEIQQNKHTYERQSDILSVQYLESYDDDDRTVSCTVTWAKWCLMSLGRGSSQPLLKISIF